MNTCPTCGKEYKGFKNQKSIDEYRISLMCQACQDNVFGEDENEEIANAHCFNCGKYFHAKEGESKSICSDKCSKEATAYLNLKNEL